MSFRHQDRKNVTVFCPIVYDAYDSLELLDSVDEFTNIIVVDIRGPSDFSCKVGIVDGYHLVIAFA